MERATISILAVASLAALAAVRVGSAAPFGHDSILVSIEDDQIREYGPTGTLIQTVSVPYPINPAPSSARVRDLVITQSGQLAVFNGTFDPYVSLYDPALDTWHHETFLGWSTGNNDRYAGIATIGPYVFVSDARTFGDDGADKLRGVIRFDTRDWSAIRFETQVGTNDVTIGLDGMLYAVGVGSTDTSLVKVFDPITLALVRTVNLSATTELNGLAVNAAGHIFGAGGVPNVNGVGGLYEFDPSGQLLRSVVTPADACRDIDLAPDGRLIFASRSDGVWSTDESMVHFVQMQTPSGPYVAFPTYVLEPTTLSLDIKPGSCPNPFNRKSKGKLPVAILGTADFDVSDIDLATVEISRADGEGGTVAPLEDPPGPHSVIEDVGTPFDGELCECHEEPGDGIDDLSMKFSTPEVVDVLEIDDLEAGESVELVVSGSLLDGTAFEARDCAVVKGKKK